MIGSCNGESKVLQVDRLELSLCREEGVLCERHVLESKRNFRVQPWALPRGHGKSLLLPALVGMSRKEVKATRCGEVAGGLLNDWTRSSQDHN